MAQVLLLVTGAMEEKALARSLRGCFPGHEFVCKPRLDGFTSARLPPDFAALSRTQSLLLNVDKFARTLIGVFDPGSRRDQPRPDYVLALEDMELVNADAPENITRTVHDAMVRNLATWPRSGAVGDRLRSAIQERCSFHLFAPMTEAYFFADAPAFARATDPGPDHPSLFDAAAVDVERFAVEDPAYLADPRPGSAACAWQRDSRRGHPKRYLEYLTDAQLDGRCRYRETTLGCNALAELSWGTVLADSGTRSPAALRFIRSLFADLSDMLGTLPVGCTSDSLDNGSCHPFTWPPARDRVMRNV